MAVVAVLVDPALPFGDQFLGFFVPVPVGGALPLYSLSAPVQ